jgi:hypothetical protein
MKSLFTDDDSESSYDLAQKMQVITAAMDLLLESEYRNLFPEKQFAIADWLNWETEQALAAARKFN